MFSPRTKAEASTRLRLTRTPRGLLRRFSVTCDDTAGQDNEEDAKDPAHTFGTILTRTVMNSSRRTNPTRPLVFLKPPSSPRAVRPSKQNQFSRLVRARSSLSRWYWTVADIQLHKRRKKQGLSWVSLEGARPILQVS